MKTELILFTIFLLVAIYLLNCLVAKGIKRIDFKLAALYIAGVALVGVAGELIVGTIYNSLFGSHLWNYYVYPLHYGFTSYYSPVIWGSYGFYLYLSHDTFLASRKVSKEKHLALIFCIETVLLETFLNFSYKLIYGNYLFYYLPADLWHLSSIRGILFYFLTGLAIFYLIRLQRQAPLKFSGINAMLLFLLLVLMA